MLVFILIVRIDLTPMKGNREDGSSTIAAAISGHRMPNVVIEPQRRKTCQVSGHAGYQDMPGIRISDGYRPDA
jgi:hypothetical protein